MPSQNRPVVKDGRLVVKKRTDRSYLKPTTPSSEGASALPEAASDVEPVQDAVATAEAVTAPAAAAVAASQPQPAGKPAPAAAAPKSATARALEQQGVRKRREVDVDAVAKRDSDYALHELRRIAILTALVVVALVVLTLTLR